MTRGVLIAILFTAVLAFTKFSTVLPAQAFYTWHNLTPKYMKMTAGPRPRRWCGWYMRTLKGGGPEFNVARRWAKYGRPATPQAGAVVVWNGHVGLIKSMVNRCTAVVHSGNDGNAVRTRPRNICNAIAVRM